MTIDSSIKTSKPVEKAFSTILNSIDSKELAEAAIKSVSKAFFAQYKEGFAEGLKVGKRYFK